MPRNCGCGGQTCGCLIVAGVGASITGSGNADDPYVVGIAGATFMEIESTVGQVDLDTLQITSSTTVKVTTTEAETTIIMPSDPAPPAGTKIDLLIANDGAPDPTLISLGGDAVVLWGGDAPVIGGPGAVGTAWIATAFDGTNWYARLLTNPA